MDEVQVARGLGALGVGLGLTQVLAPRWLGRKTGSGEYPRLMRALGARELASGVAALRRPWPAGAIWARLAGDVMDLALLTAAFRRTARRRRKRVAWSLGLVLGIAAIDYLCARRLSAD